MPTTKEAYRLAEAGLAALEGLLGSRTRARLLVAFATNPREEYYARQLIQRTRLSETAVRYELSRLTRRGFLTSRKQGQEKLYRANDRHPLFPELKQMVYKTAGLGEVLRQAIETVPGVTAAFIYGSVAKGTERVTSDIDLFILGTADRPKLGKALREAEDRVGREINLTMMSVDEWRARRKAGDGSVQDVVGSPKIFLIGDER